MRKPLGKMSPWVWSIEYVRGCNLSCWHCTARLFAKKEPIRFMERRTWDAMCKIIAKATPRTRLELAQSGEPTLHPNLYSMLSDARSLTPTTQIQVTTNGITLLTGEMTFKDLFAAGAHSIYIDMYGAEERFVEMARESGAEWYLYNQPKIGTPNHKMANTYYGDPAMRLIILQGNPETRIGWRKSGRLSTFLNHIDWDIAMPYGLIPVRESYKRKCTLPMRYVSLDYEGNYLFCCIDFWCESARLMGSVHDGIDGFPNYWFGRLMQSIRRRLATGDRAHIPYCMRCNCAFSKCDWTNLWGGDGAFAQWWDGKIWNKLPSLEQDGEVFWDGYQKAGKIKIPTEEEETACLRLSDKVIIPSTIAMLKSRR